MSTDSRDEKPTHDTFAPTQTASGSTVGASCGSAGGGFGAVALAHLLGTEATLADGRRGNRSSPGPSSTAACITAPGQAGRAALHVGRGQPVRHVRLQARSDPDATARSSIPAARSSCSRASRARAWTARGTGGSTASAANGSATWCRTWRPASTTSPSCRRWSRSRTCTARRRSCRTPASCCPGFPSMGAWISYGLGSLNENLPTFVVLPDSRGFAPNGPANWSAGFLPAAHQGTMVRPAPRTRSSTCFRPRTPSSTAEAQSDGPGSF